MYRCLPVIHTNLKTPIFIRVGVVRIPASDCPAPANTPATARASKSQSCQWIGISESLARGSLALAVKVSLSAPSQNHKSSAGLWSPNSLASLLPVIQFHMPVFQNLKWTESSAVTVSEWCIRLSRFIWNPDTLDKNHYICISEYKQVYDGINFIYVYICVCTSIFQKHIVYTRIYCNLRSSQFSYRGTVSWYFSINWYISNAVVVLTTPVLPQPQVNLIDIAATRPTTAVHQCCVSAAHGETRVLALAVQVWDRRSRVSSQKQWHKGDSAQCPPSSRLKPRTDTVLGMVRTAWPLPRPP